MTNPEEAHKTPADTGSLGSDWDSSWKREAFRVVAFALGAAVIFALSTVGFNWYHDEFLH